MSREDIFHLLTNAGRSGKRLYAKNVALTAHAASLDVALREEHAATVAFRDRAKALEVELEAARGDLDVSRSAHVRSEGW